MHLRVVTVADCIFSLVLCFTPELHWVHIWLSYMTPTRCFKVAVKAGPVTSQSFIKFTIFYIGKIDVSILGYMTRCNECVFVYLSWTVV